MHKFAEKASIAALAAAEQGKYQEFSSALLKDFKNLSDQTITKHAEAVGLNMEKFNAASSNPALKKQIQEDLQLGSSVKVRGVPSIFHQWKDAKTAFLDGFSQMIEEELKK